MCIHIVNILTVYRKPAHLGLPRRFTLGQILTLCRILHFQAMSVRVRTLIYSSNMSLHSQLKQARIIVSMAWQTNLNYRFTIFMYRFGEIAEVLILILMWSAIYAGSGALIKGFTLNEMITYVLVGNLCAVATRNFLWSRVSRDINEGRLSMYLVKPISYIKFIFITELGRIFLSTVISIISQLMVAFFFFSKVVVNTDPRYLWLILLMIFLAFIIELLVGFLIGTIAFWTDEVDGLQATIDRIKRFFSGGYFPLTLLPATIASVSTFLPFQYSFFAPAALYLKKMTLVQGLYGIGVQVVWIFLLFLLLALVWKQGLKRYEATGS